MAEKAYTENADVSHDEKDVLQDRQPSLADAAGRRKSIAMNIVENPLKVSFATSGPSPLPIITRLALMLILFPPTAQHTREDPPRCPGFR